jgi:hypothetical protein
MTLENNVEKQSWKAKQHLKKQGWKTALEKGYGKQHWKRVMENSIG